MVIGAGKKENMKKDMYRVGAFLFVRDVFIGRIGFPGPERSSVFSQTSTNICGVIDE